MSDPSSASSTPGSTTCRASPSSCPTGRSPSSPGPPAPASARSPSTRSTPRDSGATSSRSPPTPSSSSSGWRSRSSTASRASRPRSRSSSEPDRQQPLHRRHRHRDLRLPAPALGPRRPDATAASAARRCAATRRSRRPTTCWPPCPAARLQVAFPLPPSARVTHDAVVENLRALGFVRVAGRRRRAAPRRAAARRSTSRARRSCWSSSTGSSADAGGARAGSAEAVAHGVPGGRRRSRVVLVRPLDSGAGRLRFTALPRLQRLRHAGGDRHARSSSRSTTRAAPAPRATASARCSSTTSRSIVPDPARSPRATARSIPWTKPRYENSAARSLEFARARGRSRSTPVAASSRRAQRRELLYGESARLRRDLPLPQGPRGEALQAVHPRLPAAVSARAGPVRPAAAAGSTPRRCGPDRRATRSPRSRRCRSIELHRVARRARAHRRSSARSPRTSSRSCARPRAASSATSGSATSRSTAQTRTLSGGEAQRIALANALGSQLVDTLYVLDEPSIGLHPRDMDRLLALLRRLRDARQHGARRRARPRRHPRRPTTWSSSGPASGEQRRPASCYAGPMSRVAESPLTGQYLTGEKRIAVPERAGARRAAAGSAHAARASTTSRASTSDIPLGALTAVTGVSGSRQEHARPRRALPRARDAAPRRALGQAAPRRAGRRSTTRSPAGSCSTTSCWSTSARSASRRAPIRSPTSRRSTRSASSSPPQPLARQREYTAGTFSLQRRRRPLRGVRGRRARRRSRWSSWPTCSSPATSAAASASSREVLDVQHPGPARSTTCSS